MITVLTAKPPTLEEALAIVGGYVQMITLPNGDQLLVDEEGLLKNLPVNMDATIAANRLIVGPALLLEGDARWT
jgi:hypothetical protein